MACALQREGCEVGVLALMDAYPPATGFTFELPPDEDLAAAAAESAPLAGVDEARGRRMLEVWKRHYAITGTFPAARFEGDMILLAATGDGYAPAPEKWREHVSGSIRVHEIPCTHNDLISPANVAAAGRLLRQYFEVIQGENETI